MINPALLTDSLAKRVAEDVICSCCVDNVVLAISDELAEVIKRELIDVPRSYISEIKRNLYFEKLFRSLRLYELKFKAMIKGIWEQERQIIVANLKKLKKAWLGKGGDEGLVNSVLFPKAQMQSQVVEKSEGLYIKVIDMKGNQEMDNLATDVFFDVENPEVKKWLEEYVPKFSKNLEAVSTEKLRATLLEGLHAGEGIPQLIKRINGTYDHWSKYRSETIARSEVIRASNRGALEAYRQSGVVRAKIWITHLGPATCDWCASLDGKIIGLDENYFNKGDSFTVGKQTMNLGYENVDSPPLHPRCRCAISASFYDPITGLAQPKDLFSDITTNPTKYKKEFGAWFDQRGNVIMAKKGTAERVALTPSQWTKLRSEDIKVMIHTHPSHMAFSGGDLAHAAALNVEEMQVLTHKGLYKIKPKRWKNWGFDKDLIEGEYNGLCNSLMYKYNDRYNQLVSQGKTLSEAKNISNTERIDEVVRAMAKKYNLNYSFEGH